MTWLYVPSTASPSAPASADWSSASELPNPERAASCTWRGKPQPPQAWSRAWKRGGFIRLLSGLMQEPSTLDHGVESLISSLRATRASPTASPERGSVQPTTAGSLTGCSASSTTAGLVVSSARTSRGTPTGSSPPSSQHWKGWVAALRAEFSAREARARATAASACSSWPTATTMDSVGARNRTSGRSNPDSQHHDGVTLLDATIIHGFWPAPTVADAASGPGHAGEGGMNLRTFAPMWPTPACRDYRSDFAQMTDEELYGSKGPPLSRFATHRFQPSPPDPQTPVGPPSSPERRSLNPLFVEWLMGWPTGLSGFERAETAFVPWLRQMRGCLSALLSSRTAEPEQGRLL
jgi:hypothetical protein